MQTWGLTDPGNIRQQNQDSYAIVPFARDRVHMIVCDGMGLSLIHISEPTRP